LGYTTYFKGGFVLDKEPNEEVIRLLNGLEKTRRMKRNVDEKIYGTEGEFYFGPGNWGQDHESNIIDYNFPPKTQPGLWCKWELVLSDDNSKWEIKWDEGEKFYHYIEWIQYIIDKVLKPNKIELNGEVEWKGESSDDMGKIIIKSNKVSTKKGVIAYI